METYKTPLEQSKSLLEDRSPFDKDHIDTKGGTAAERFQKSRLVNLTADEYYKLVANEGGAKLGGIENTDWKKLMEQRARVPNELGVQDMEKMMREGTKFPTPWLYMHDKLGSHPYFQEGLHRMLAAKNVYGENARFPVWLGYDEDSAEDFEGIDSGDIDNWISAMNERRRQRQIDHDNAEWEKEQEIERYYRQTAAEWMNKPLDQITDEDVKAYKRYEDELFRDEWND